MKTHEECAALLDAFIDGELSAADADAVREHLAECEDCAVYVSDALTMRELFPALDETIVPDGFAESVIASLPPQLTITPPESASVTQIAETPQTAEIASTAVKRWKRWINLAAPLAACLAIVLLIHGFGVFRPKGMGAASPESAMDTGGVAGYGAASSSAADSGADGAALYAATTADETESAETEEAAPQDLYEYQVEESVLEDSAGASGGSAARKSTGTDDNGTRNAAASGANRNASGNENGAFYDGDTAPTPEPSENAEISAYVAPSAQSDAATEAAERSGAATEAAEMKSRTAGETPPQSTETTSETPSASMATPETPSAAPTEEEAAPDLDAESLSVWTLSAGGASLLERYRPVATTERGAWYALTDAQFDALWDELINGETSATLKVSDATPPKSVPNAVYVLLTPN